MLNRIQIILLLTTLLSLWSWENNAQNTYADEYGNIASISGDQTFNDTVLYILNEGQILYNNSPKLIYYFNGDCSSCIAAFIKFLKVWQKTELIIPAFFIASAPNLDILSYYMERAELKLEKSLQFLILDNKNLVDKYNQFMNHVENTIYILLVNEKNDVIEYKNPFLNKSTMNKFMQINDHYKISYRPTAIPQVAKSSQQKDLDFIDENNPPLIIIDGKENSLGGLKEVKEQVIEWSYVEGVSAVLLYGTEGKNGVLEVRTQ